MKPDEFAAAWQNAWNSRQPDRVLEMCTDDVVWDDPLTDAPERGQAAVRFYLERAWRAFPDMAFTYPEPAYARDRGRHLALHWRLTATMLGAVEPPGFAPTGRRVDADGIDLLSLRDGKVANYVGIFDAREMAQQLGVLPTPGSGAERLAVGLQRLTARFQR